MTNEQSAFALASVLGFAEGHIARLDEYASHWEKGESGRIRLVDKVATEGALLLLLARRTAARWPQVVSHCASLAETLIPRIRSARLRSLLVRSPQSAATLGAGHIFLAAAGFPNEAFDELVRNAIEDGFADTVERLPYRLLDQRWARNLVTRDPVPFDDLLAFSILRSRAHPLYMTQTDAYAITHAVMYVTDFGGDALPAVLNSQKVRAMVEQGLAWHILSEDFDLLVEYLICAECVGLGMSSHARFAHHLVRRTWAELQFLPGPTFDPERYRACAGAAAEAYAVEHMYHTNFVWGMYCAIHLRNLYEEKPYNEADEAADGIERLLALALSTEGTRASVRSPWFTAITDAPLGTPELEDVLWHAIAIEAARRDDWSQVATLVGMADNLRTPPAATLQELNYMQTRLRRYS